MSDDVAQLVALLTSPSPAQRVGAAIGMAKTVAEDAGISRDEFIRLCGSLWDQIDRMNAASAAGAN